MIERITLPSGEWIEFATRLNHAQVKRVRAARPAGLDPVDEGLCAMAQNWLLRDVDGRDIPFPGAAVNGIPSEAIATIPFDTFVLIAVEVGRIVSEGMEIEPPKAGGKPRPSSPPANGAQSIPSLPISTSSQTTPDGPGSISSTPLPT